MRVETLTDYLARNKVPAGMLDIFGDKEWRMVADQAGVQPPDAANIQAIRGNLADYEAASQITAKTPAEAAAEFAQNRSVRTKRQAPAAPADLEGQLADSVAAVQKGERPVASATVRRTGRAYCVSKARRGICAAPRRGQICHVCAARKSAVQSASARAARTTGRVAGHRGPPRAGRAAGDRRSRARAARRVTAQTARIRDDGGNAAREVKNTHILPQRTSRGDATAARPAFFASGGLRQPFSSSVHTRRAARNSCRSDSPSHSNGTSRVRPRPPASGPIPSWGAAR